MNWKVAKDAWGSIPPLARDLLIAVVVIALLMGSLWTYTGQPLGQAPLVVVESGSMMHPDAGYGRLKTIDPGDLILVKRVPEGDPLRVVTLYGSRASGPAENPGEGRREGFGMAGDVIIFRQDDCKPNALDPPPIIHRALTWVEVHGSGSGRTYSYHDEDGVWRTNEPNVDLAVLGSAREFQRSGWVTKGDNPQTNHQADQAGICQNLLIQPEWLIGKARGEIPWIGLLKFMFQGNNPGRAPDDWCTVGRAQAPCDTFTMLWISLGVLVAIPVAWDVTSRILARRRDDEHEGDEDADEDADEDPDGRDP